MCALKILRIVIDTDNISVNDCPNHPSSSFTFTVKLRIDFGPNSNIAILWARRENYQFPHEESKFVASVEKNGSLGEYYTSNETDHYTFKFREIMFSNSWSVEFVYSPNGEPKWWSLPAWNGGYRLNVTNMSVNVVDSTDMVGSMTSWET